MARKGSEDNDLSSQKTKLAKNEKLDIRAWFLSQLEKPPSKSDHAKSTRKVTFGPIPQDSFKKGAPEVVESLLTVSLDETETIWFLTIASRYEDAVSTDRPEVTIQETEVAAKPRLKSLHAETQTPKSSEKAKGNETVQVKTTSSFVNASAWDLYDTYAQVGNEEGFGIKEFQFLIDTAFKSRAVLQTQPGSGSEYTRLPADKQMNRLIKTSQFNYCVLAIERLLASKTFEKKQSLLKKPLRDKYASVTDSNFSYQISILWTYDNHFENPLAVTSLDWNSKNPLLLAVGYGLLNYLDPEDGCVCVWSPKNPSHPEKKLLLQYSVTALCFSSDQPNILAAGTRSGLVVLIDVANMEKVSQIFPKDNDPPKFGPIWRMQWVFQSSAGGSCETLLVLSDAGALFSLSPFTQKPVEDILKLNYTLLVKSDIHDRHQHKPIFTIKSLSGLWFSIVADQHVCYIASKEGLIVKCNIRSPYSTGIRTLAHLGPVYVIQHSPAMPRCFLTCGADHCLKIWIDGILEPLLTLVSAMQMPMVSAEWSPILPTVIASLTSFELAIWDIAQNTSEPVNTFKLRSSDLNFTSLKFAPDGMGLVVGDHLGHAKLYQLQQLPRTPFLYREALTSALISALVPTPHLHYKLTELPEQ